MRYLASFFALLFIWFAYLQLNDPDPTWWITLYLVPAYISFRMARKEFSPELVAVVSIIYIAYGLNSWLQMSGYEGFFTEGAGMEMKTVNQELAREAAGLGICIFSFLIYTLYFFLRKPKPAREITMAENP